MSQQKEYTLDEIQNFEGTYPKQIWMLFMTEMWERFTFYGMRALLMLFMTSQMHFDDKSANLTYGAYQAFVYTMPVWGGWLADKLIGQRVSILFGGILMALGNFTLAIPSDTAFYFGLGLIIVGNGFFKPNISTMVGNLYKQNDDRRDSGFSLFYMGINVGATLGGFICGYVGQTISWHLGFALAGFFMLLGLIVFNKGQYKLGPIGLAPEGSKQHDKIFAGLSIKQLVFIGSILLVPLFVVLLKNFTIINYIINPIGLFALIYVLYLGFKEGKEAFGRIVVAMVLILFSMLFWAFYEQGGGSLSLYSNRNVDMTLFGIQLSSAAVNNSINGAMIVLLTPFFGWLWITLSKRNANPNTIVKFALGIIQLGLGFYMFVLGAQTADANGLVNLFWFTAGYFFMTTGELCLSPIGLSVITKLSPAKMAGLMMGMWFLASAFGQYLAGLIGSMMAIPASEGGEKMSALESLPIYTDIFNQITMVAIGSGIFLLILSPFLRKHMHGVK